MKVGFEITCYESIYYTARPVDSGKNTGFLIGFIFENIVFILVLNGKNKEPKCTYWYSIKLHTVGSIDHTAYL